MPARMDVSITDVFIRNAFTYVVQITVQMISFRSIEEFRGCIFLFLAHYRCGHTKICFSFFRHRLFHGKRALEGAESWSCPTDDPAPTRVFRKAIPRWEGSEIFRGIGRQCSVSQAAWFRGSLPDGVAFFRMTSRRQEWWFENRCCLPLC